MCILTALTLVIFLRGVCSLAVPSSHHSLSLSLSRPTKTPGRHWNTIPLLNTFFLTLAALQSPKDFIPKIPLQKKQRCPSGLVNIISVGLFGIMLTINSAELDRKLFLTILNHLDVKIDCNAASKAFEDDGVPCTARAVEERLKKLKKMAQEDDK